MTMADLEEMKEHILGDLKYMGPLKPLGYLPLQTIQVDQIVRHIAKFWLEESHPVCAVIRRAFAARFTSDRGLGHGA
jgi:hypothetical protein